MASRNLDDLCPKVETAAKAFLADCTAHGYDVLVTCTYRSPEEQTALYAEGRTAPGNIVTNAKANQSMHQFRCALDIVPMRNGKCVWNGSDPLWVSVLTLAKEHGFELGAEWHTFVEKPHLQMTGGHPLSYFQAGGKL